MSQYKVIIKEEAQADLKNLLRYEPKAYKKALRFIGELYDHPKTGLGNSLFITQPFLVSHFPTDQCLSLPASPKYR